MREPLFSVIIVNRNTKYLLYQCLCSVEKGLSDLPAEIWVVDNASTDGSLDMLRLHFPTVHLIANSVNIGYTKANNQAIRQAKGQYLLLLNTDIILEEGTFQTLLDFFRTHPDAGAVGPKILQPNGRFSVDSRRDLPSAWNIFTKITGLYKFRPGSRFWGSYHLTYLSPEETTAVPVLLGAFMCIPRKVLEEVGDLDERFFMYAEDIDICYRISKAGYKNYYVPELRTIHYKGETTRLHSLLALVNFYKSAIQYVQKYYRGGLLYLVGLLYQFGLVFVGLLSLLKHLLGRIKLPLLDGLLVWGGLQLTKWIGGIAFPHTGLYALGQVLMHGLLGNYRAPYSLKRLGSAAALTGLLGGLLSYYYIQSATDPKPYLLAVLGSFSLSTLVRIALNGLQQGHWGLGLPAPKRTLILAAPEQFARLRTLFQAIRYPMNLVGFISPTPHSEAIGTIEELDVLIPRTRAQELIFCNTSIPYYIMMSVMTRHASPKLSFKMIPPGAEFVVGPRGSWTGYLPKSPTPQKRAIELVSALFLMIVYPVTFWLYQEPWGSFKHWYNTCLQAFSWKDSRPLSNKPKLTSLDNSLVKDYPQPLTEKRRTSLEV